MDRIDYQQRVEDFHEEYFDGTNNQEYNRAYQDLTEVLSSNTSPAQLEDALDNYFKQSQQASERVNSRFAEVIHEELLPLKNESHTLLSLDNGTMAENNLEFNDDLRVALNEINSEIENTPESIEEKTNDIQSLLNNDNRTPLQDKELGELVQSYADESARLLGNTEHLEKLKSTMDFNQVDFEMPDLTKEIQQDDTTVNLDTQADLDTPDALATTGNLDELPALGTLAPTSDDLSSLEAFALDEPLDNAVQLDNIDSLDLDGNMQLDNTGDLPDFDTGITNADALEQTVELDMSGSRANEFSATSNSYLVDDIKNHPANPNRDLEMLEDINNQSIEEEYSYTVGNTRWKGPGTDQAITPITDLETLEKTLADLVEDRKAWEKTPSIDQHFDEWKQEPELDI